MTTLSTLAKRTLLATALAAAAVPALAFEPDTLTVWVGPNRDVAALQAIGDRFTEELGIPVTVLEVDPLPEKFQQAAATGDGPDLALYAHDRFGEWAAGGLISPVTLSPATSEGLVDTALDAVSFGGKVWGYPVSVEAVGLIWNKALVDAPPESFEEIGDMEIADGRAPILWDYDNTYFTFPLLAANGGYAFEKVDGSYDGSRTGVNTEGAIEGAEVLDAMIEAGTMPKGVDYGVMDAAMSRGDVAMVINGPWAWAGLKGAGIDFAVAPLPSVGGKPAVPFVGVQAFAVNAASPNKDLAAEFVENHLMSDESLAEWNARDALGTLADLSASAGQTDPNVVATLEIAKSGVPMPSNPEMGAFWSAMEPALANITSQAQEPKAALDDAAARILGE